MYRAGSDAFSGEGEEALFETWSEQLRARMAPYHLSASDEINTIKANTSGAALALVKHMHAAAGADAKAALRDIWQELRRRYGSGPVVVAALRKKLDAVVISKSDSPLLGQQIRQLRDVCLLIQRRINPSSA